MNIEISMDEILEDLCHNGLPPGRWNIPNSDRSSSRGEPPALEARVDLGVDQRHQPLAAAILHEVGELVGDSVS
jgi:hypothetical protein